MNNYCKHLKKRNNKPYCKLINKEITFSLCRECDNKEYKAKIKENSFYKIKMHNKSKKLTVTKDTYNYVIGRDNYSCRLCGSTSFLQLHHILYRSQRKDLINDVDNCIMLCSDCHRLVHSNKKKWQPILLDIKKDTSQLV